MINPIEIDKRRNISVRLRNKFIDMNVNITVRQANNIADMILTISRSNDGIIEYAISHISNNISIYANVDFDGINRIASDIISSVKNRK